MFIIFSYFHIFFSVLCLFSIILPLLSFSSISPRPFYFFIYRISPFSLVPSTSTLQCALFKWKVYSVYRYICTGLAICFLLLLKLFIFKKLIYWSKLNVSLFFWQFSSFLYLISEHARDSHISERWLQNSVCWSHESF